MNKDRVEVLMMAGGIGRRMSEITGYRIPKALLPLKHNFRAIDFIVEQLERIGVEATWSADNYYYLYQDSLKKTSQRMLWQKPGGTTEMVNQPGGTVLAIAPDCIFPYRDIPEMIGKHLPGTITWAVSRFECPEMDEYRGMDVLPNGAIVGRKDKSVVRAPVIIVDNGILNRYRHTGVFCSDIFYDVMPLVESSNKKFVRAGKSSILNAYFLSGPVVDFGTPPRYFELTNNLDKYLDKVLE